MMKLFLIFVFMFSEVASANLVQVGSESIELSHPHYSLTTAITVPQPLALGLQVEWDSLPGWQAFAEGGYFRYPFSASATRQGSVSSLIVGVRRHPFLNWFYWGTELGYHHLGLTADISNIKMDGIPLASDAKLGINAFFVGLLAGAEWKLSQSLSLAFDLGVQIPIFHGGSVTINPNASDPNPGNLRVDDDSAMDRLSGFPLPQIALIRLIWAL